VPLIEPAVSYACAYDKTDDHPHKEFVGPIIGAVLVLVEFDLDEVTEIDTYSPQQTIPTYASFTYVNEYWINIPNNG
jgi:hypothetical protein